MKMRKIFAGMTALAMMAAMAVPAMATEVVAEGTNNSTVSYTQTQSFSVTIPATTTVDSSGKTGTGKIEVTEAVIDPAKSVQVKLTAATYDATLTKFAMKIDDTHKVGYAIAATGATITPADSVNVQLLAVGANATGETTVTYTADAAKWAGTYSDILTFTVALADTVTDVTANGGVIVAADTVG